jgi:BirA family biotin operon repressor/biotin-[acetyl-CoA-carboxylase] ligase
MVCTVDPVCWRVEEFASIDSTNTWLSERAARGAPEGLVAMAEFQSAGRGRLGRTWESPPRSSLLTSILLRPTVVEEDRHLATVIVALAARAALVRLCGVRPSLKWPNDLVVVDAKLGGILAEAVLDDAGELAIVVGLGLNLTQPGPPEAHGTCVRDLAGVTLDPRAVLDLLLEELEPRLALLKDGDRAVLRSEFAMALGTIGRAVRVEGHRGTLEGLARGVDDAGRLEVATDDGAVVVVDVGDVVHLRVAPR